MTTNLSLNSLTTWFTTTTSYNCTYSLFQILSFITKHMKKAFTYIFHSPQPLLFITTNIHILQRYFVFIFLLIIKIKCFCLLVCAFVLIVSSYLFKVEVSSIIIIWKSENEMRLSTQYSPQYHSTKWHHWKHIVENTKDVLAGCLRISYFFKIECSF